MNDLETIQRRIRLHHQALYLLIPKLLCFYLMWTAGMGKKLMKRCLVFGYCHGFIPAFVVSFCFRIFRLREV